MITMLDKISEIVYHWKYHIIIAYRNQVAKAIIIDLFYFYDKTLYCKKRRPHYCGWLLCNLNCLGVIP